MQTILFLLIEGGNCPKGEKARGVTAQGAIILGGNWPRGELSWGELTMRELSIGRLT